MICPICGEYACFAFTKNTCQIFECSDCAHRYVQTPLAESHVQNLNGDHCFTEEGAGCPGYLRQGVILRERGQWYAKLLAKHMNPGRMLDVGAASGFMLGGFLDNGWQGIGVEPNDTMARFGREKLNIPVQTGAFENFEGTEKFDLVSMIQVLPHFFDLDRALSTAANATADDGYWLVEMWNRGSWTASIFGSYWHEYSPPSVVRWFAPYDLNLAAAKYGFEPVASGRPRRRVHGAPAKSLLTGKLVDEGFLGRALRRLVGVIPDNLQIPYPSEDLYWSLFKKVRAGQSSAADDQNIARALPRAAE